ncbi:kinase [Nocardia sp. NPDC056100]|uniref:phosphotransferase-like protein n=1 Tax=Nocardia sp. NPDC056100 TaxID=3345712 RepID=UPI0035E3B06D
MPDAVMLYGPPAAGKDTVTKALANADPTFVLFKRLKVGGGRTDTYRITTDDQIAALARAGEIIWQNSRYDATYAVDRPEIQKMLMANMIPVLHLGQAEAIDVIRSAIPDVRWTVVELWCPKDLAEQRIRARNTNDVAARLVAWDETPRLIPGQVDLGIDTSQTAPTESAIKIRHAMESSCPST